MQRMMRTRTGERQRRDTARSGQWPSAAPPRTRTRTVVRGVLEVHDLVHEVFGWVRVQCLRVFVGFYAKRHRKKKRDSDAEISRQGEGRKPESPPSPPTSPLAPSKPGLAVGRVALNEG